MPIRIVAAVLVALLPAGTMRQKSLYLGDRLVFVERESVPPNRTGPRDSKKRRLPWGSPDTVPSPDPAGGADIKACSSERCLHYAR